MILMYLMIVVLAVPICIYMYFFIKGICSAFGAPVDKKPVRAAIAAAAVFIAVLCCNIFSMGAIIALHIMAVSLILRLINFVVKKAAKDKYECGFKVWKKIYGSQLITIIVTAVIIIYGHFNMMNVVETDYTIYTDKAIREDGYRIALIADVHYGVSLDGEEFKEKCAEISGKGVDIVVLCGDIVDENTTNEQMHEVFEALGSIRSTYGTFFVYGNHDRQLYRDERAYTEAELAEAIEESGITILQDDSYNINDEFTIVGREDISYNDKKQRKGIAELTDGLDEEDFILVLDHQPKQYEENGKAGTDLLLSGHTHSGQIWPANILFAIVKFDDAVYGYTEIDEDTQAFVTSGFAGWGYSIKTSAPAEYVILDIAPH